MLIGGGCCPSRVIMTHSWDHGLLNSRTIGIGQGAVDVTLVCLACMELWVWSLALHKQGMAVHTNNCYSAWGMEGGRPEVLGYPWLHSEFKTSLGYIKINLAASHEHNFQNLRQSFPTCPQTSGISLMCVNSLVKSQRGFDPFHFLMSNFGNPCHVYALILLAELFCWRK